MKVIISPAKKMRDLGDEISREGESLTLPEFLADSEKIQRALRQMDGEALRELWKCNEKIAKLGRERLEQFSLERCRSLDEKKQLTANTHGGRAGAEHPGPGQYRIRSRRGTSFEERYLALCTPALLAYEGIQYQYMAPQVFVERQWDYAEKHLRILSGFYGILRPLDGVLPYRLEMQARLSVDGKKDLYAYWGDRICQALIREASVVVNLASKEYSRVIEKYLPEQVQYVTCIFGELIQGKVKVKGTQAKMARGEMVRWMAEHQVEEPEKLREFDGLGYRYEPELSDGDNLVFLKGSGL